MLEHERGTVSGGCDDVKEKKKKGQRDEGRGQKEY